MDEIYEPSQNWQKTLERVVPAVVAIKFCTVRAFDTERPGFGVATGFIVDKHNGIILTNRHVVRPGPVVAEAVFLDHEEIDIRPLYRDPIHDFGFYKFNPKDVKYMEVQEIQLAPEEAQIGIEIRVVGNDAGEKLSILAGTLARLDRAAPAYGEDEYNDFNTFYFQAASNTSGGSSGSPVINMAGKAVALNAGGRKQAASSFYLPLDRVARALKLVREGNNVARGDIQTVFRHCPYDQVHRLGLRDETESLVRKSLPKETGMLVVDQVVPQGPTHNILNTGDILVNINKKLITTFIELESILDSNIGGEITLDIERGGVAQEHKIKVQDLHSITPDKFLEFGGAILHLLSYQSARNHRLPVGSVYVANEGYILGRSEIRRGSIIKAIGQTEITDLESFERVIAALPSGTRIPVHFFHVTDRNQDKVAVIRVDRGWHNMEMWTRNDTLGIWNCRHSPAPPKPDWTPKPASTSALQLTSEIGGDVARSLVMVTYNIPYVIDGGSSDSYIGVGVIVDAQKGLIIVDKNTVPIPLGDLSISFGASVEIPGEVLFLHPIHNFAVIRYDPSLILDNGSFKGAELCNDLLKAGDDVWLVGLSRSQQPFCQSTSVSKMEELFINESNPPRYRAYNEEVVHLDKAASCVGGVLINRKGQIQAIWASYSSSDKKNSGATIELYRGMPVYLLNDVISPLMRGEQPQIRSLEAEFWPVNLAEARNMGLPDEWIEKVIQKGRRQVLIIRRLVAKTDAASKLKTGDILVAINGNLLTTFKEVEDITQSTNGKPLELTILRKQAIIQEQVSPVLLDGKGTDRIVFWAGAHFQDTHRAVAQLGIVSEGVYCSRWYYGSPAHKYGLRATWWVTEVNGTPTPDLDTFLNVVKDCQHNTFVRLKVVGLQDKVGVITIKMDLTYYPTHTLKKTPESRNWTYEHVHPSTPQLQSKEEVAK